jgi:NAD(P)-dependent dehydrogenase (short-subunit alcohol dehydrogenase family)
MKKIALITGSAKRLGKAIALHLATNGWEVAIHYNRSSEAASQTLKELSKITKAIAIQQDLNDLDIIPGILEQTELGLGSPSLLINNAGIFERDQKKMSALSLQKHMNINCFAPIILTQALSELNSNKKTIINIGDSNLKHTYKSFLPYMLSKLSLQNSEKSLNSKFFLNCKVYTINPGMVTAPEDYYEKKIFKKILLKSPSRSETNKSALEKIDLILKS